MGGAADERESWSNGGGWVRVWREDEDVRSEGEVGGKAKLEGGGQTRRGLEMGKGGEDVGVKEKVGECGERNRESGEEKHTWGKESKVEVGMERKRERRVVG